MKILDQLINRLTYLFIFLIPWQTRYFISSVASGGYSEYSIYSFYLTDLLLLIIAILVLVRIWKKKVAAKISLSWWLLAAFEFFLLVSAISGLDWQLSLSRYFWFLAAAFCVYLLTKQSTIERKKLWLIFLLSAILPAILGISQFVTNYAASNKYLGLAEHNPQTLGVSVLEYSVNGQVVRQLRAYGPFDHPNIMGGFLALVLLSAVIYFSQRKENLFFQNKPKLFNRLAVIYLGLITIALVLSFSRAAILAAVVSLLIYLIFNLVNQKLKLDKGLWLVFVTIFLAMIISGLALRPLWSSRLSSDNRLAIISQSERLAGYGQASQVIKNNWWLGTGLGNYTLELQKIKPNHPTYYYQPIHNVWVLLWAEVGIFGLLAILAWLGYIFWQWQKQNLAVTLALAASLVILTCLDHWLFSLHIGWLLWGIILSAIVWGYQKPE